MNRIVMLRMAVIATVAVLVAGCGPSIKVKYDSDPDADFGSFKTWSWISDHPMIINKESGQTVNPLIEDRIKDEIKAGLIAKNLRFVDSPADADAAVSFTIGARTEISSQSYPTGYAGGGWGGRYYGGVGYGTTTQVESYTKGTLAIDIFDAKTKKPVWHGTAEKKVYSSDSSDKQKENIQLAVGEILNNYPQPPPK